MSGRQRQGQGALGLERVERWLTRVCATLVSVLLCVQLLLANEPLRARLNFLDAVEGAPLPAVARGPAVPADGADEVPARAALTLVSGSPQPALRVVVNGIERGRLHRGALDLLVDDGDLLELDGRGLSRAVTVWVQAAAPVLHSPRPGTAVTVRPGQVEVLGRCRVGPSG